ncbi:MAG: OadG family transporter subunit [Chloroflexota bacterium]
MDEFSIGITISVLGIGVLFAALGLLTLVILLLSRLFRPVSKDEGEEKMVQDETEGLVSASQREKRPLVAAVAVAVSHLLAEEKKKAGLGQSLHKGPGKYWDRKAK